MEKIKFYCNKRGFSKTEGTTLYIAEKNGMIVFMEEGEKNTYMDIFGPKWLLKKLKKVCALKVW